ncbi:DUF4389 domain-containing protein [Candidatus Poriferisodalis sp.]|uniref:DUF4389 domain-containing protein n=1 Tax=Candidatus Poriferisodalis sp. TaxID=3101277 RepID=UPI003B025D5F
MSTTEGASAPAEDDYPARLDVEYPEGGLSRAKTFFRIILVIPIAIVAGLVSGSIASNWDPGQTNAAAVVTAGGLFGPTLLMLLFRRKYPRWWFDWNLELTRFSARVNAYLSMMRDEYPSTDEEQAVALDLDYPDAGRDLKRWLPLVKWLLAIPHYIVLAVLAVAAIICVVIAWFAILFTGRYPRGLFDFVLGVHRWGLRVGAYMWLLITDRYPPFSLR